ncbi:LAGLIDADG family homing endonuclease [Streptomyces angustmyceticus]|uniref:LAGLIDADG family homing endonuclease n=1 Tax=Streptomyces angustmyceticus TaxID=285578 RepID=UPI003D940D80
MTQLIPIRRTARTPSRNLTHVVMWSGGITSWATARHVIAQHGTASTVLLFADTLIEDEDLYTFNEQASAQLGVPITRVADGRDPWQVFEDARWLGNTRIAQCSHVLKQEPCRAWLTDNTDPASTAVYVGIDWSETHRMPSINDGWAPWPVDAPLTRPPYRDKHQLLAEARAAGLPKPRLYGYGFTHNNCLHPDTRFITDQGIKTLRECEGQKVRVLGRGGGWHDANIKSFGEQPTFEIKLRRYADEKTVIATADHLWPVRKAAGRSDYRFKATLDLLSGARIAGMYGKVRHNVTPSTIGIMAGFTYGDGTAPHLDGGQVQPARAYLCGDKDRALLPFFAGCRIREEADKVIVLDLPRSWKQPPPLNESQSYLYGWLAGYFAADGSVSKGSATISSASLSSLEVVRDVAARIGIATGRIRTEHRLGYGSEPSALHRVALLASTLREDFFLLPEHRARFLSAKSQPRPADWTVVSVTPTSHVEEVMCAVVPDGHLFTLEDNLLTHNCGGSCVKGGQAQWARLLEIFPERYARAEAAEAKMRRLLGKDVSILRDRTGGQTRPLTLATLRHRIEQQPEQLDLFDEGGCGCFTSGGSQEAAA